MQRYLLIYFSIMLSVATYAQQLTKHEEQFVDSMMNANYKSNEPGAVLLIAKKGQPIYRKAYGLASLELNVPNKPEYVFRIASMSKQFTAVCVLKLAQEGKINLQDDITKYLPAYNTHGSIITIENLLGHTNGIPDLAEKKEFLAQSVLNQTHEELMNSFMNDSLAFEPGTDWGYSNSGYAVAAVIVEKVSGLSFGEYLQQTIFNPLGLSHTAVGTYDSLIMNAVNGYTVSSGKFKPIDYMSWSWTLGAGGIVSSADDLLKWDNALYTDKIIKQEWLQKAWKPLLLPNGLTTNYGFGWTINNFHGLQFIEHAGGLNGFSSDGIRIPSQQLYLVILSNKNMWPVPMLSSIALRLTGQNIIKSSANRLDKKAMEDYTGVYAINHNFYAKSPVFGNQLYQNFTTKEDTLFAQYPGYSKNPLLNVGKDIFVAAGGIQYYEFHRNVQNNIISVEIYSEPIQTGPHETQLKTDLPLPKEKHAINLEAKKLELLRGKYDFGGGLIVPVIVEGKKIFMPMPGGEKEEIFAENETKFFSKTTDITIEFIKDNGKVLKMNILGQGTKFEGKKVE